MIKKINDEALRIVNIDFLRGFFVMLAMLEHYSFFISNWYIENFKEFAAVKSLYVSHLPMLGKSIPADKFVYALGIFFIPWVSQIYLTLATFNVANKSANDSRLILNEKVKFILILLGIFYIENFLVSYDFGQAISIYPIMLWMLVLLAINIVYALTGVKGMLVLTAISFLRWILPIEYWSESFEELVKINIHPSFDYDARIEYFLTSGCIGFFLGYLHYQRKEIGVRKELILFLLGIIFIGIYFYFQPHNLLDASNPYHYEHEASKSFIGSLFIWGAEVAVISLFLFLERINIKFNLKLFTWIGTNSLFVFLCHKIFFLKIVMPITLFIYAKLGLALTDTFYELFSYIFIVLGMCWIVLRYNLLGIITRDLKANN